MQIMIGARVSALEMAIEFEATHVIRIGKNLSGTKKFFFLPEQSLLLLELESNNVKIEAIKQLLNFVKKLPKNSRLFIHCASGMTRSAAAAIIAACATDRNTPPAEHFKRMLEMNPRIVPQRKMMAIADDLLGLEGELKKYAEKDWYERLRNIRPLVITATSQEEMTKEITIPMLAKLYKKFRFSFAK